MDVGCRPLLSSARRPMVVGFFILELIFYPLPEIVHTLAGAGPQSGEELPQLLGHKFLSRVLGFHDHPHLVRMNTSNASRIVAVPQLKAGPEGPAQQPRLSAHPRA
jgi:hypothetical protein